MSAKSKSDKRKPGPDPERLVIEDDPAEALDKLLGKAERQYKCPVCGGETPLKQAMAPRGVTIYLHCSHCGETLSDDEVGRRRLLAGD